VVSQEAFVCHPVCHLAALAKEGEHVQCSTVKQLAMHLLQTAGSSPMVSDRTLWNRCYIGKRIDASGPAPT
jgi:hypothetical protein